MNLETTHGHGVSDKIAGGSKALIRDCDGNCLTGVIRVRWKVLEATVLKRRVPWLQVVQSGQVTHKSEDLVSSAMLND